MKEEVNWMVMTILSIGRPALILFLALFFSPGLALCSPLAQEGFGDPALCKSCHQQEFQDWSESHHDKAMQKASSETVLGDFDDTEITVKGVTTRFFKKGEEYWVNTESKDGSLKDYQVEYTFGFEPLQQYLVKTERGKYQVLPLSWDSRPEDRGGQRWFHIYADDHVPHNDRLHWTQPLQNWNGMCADCHSTGLKRNYDPDKNQFATIWQDINVTCVSCHGLGEIHRQKMLKTSSSFLAALIEEKKGTDYFLSLSPNKGEGAWELSEGDRTVHWQGEKRDRSQIEVCAACHSRRAPLRDGFEADGKFLDQFLPELITRPQYHADGQIRDEVYVWGSFLQSKMSSKGVVCSDCHNPHSLKLKAEGNDLCAQCHQPEYFDVPSHHQHKEGSKGAQCVNCHMPETTYMQVDPRRDHSLRIPRPDLTIKLGSPNACTSCHEEKTAEWAVNALKKWPQYVPSETPHYGEILQDVLDSKPGALQRLQQLLGDDHMPEIIRASGYMLLSSFPPDVVELDIKRGVASTSPLIRIGAVRAAVILPASGKNNILGPLLSDDTKAVRVEAARILSETFPSPENNPWYSDYEKAFTELKTVNEGSAWRGEGRVNLAMLLASAGDRRGSEQNYRASLEIDPYFSPGYVNLADLMRIEGREQEGRRVIEQGLRKQPADGSLNYAMGLALIRSGEKKEALKYLETAVTSAEENMRYAYVYSVALNELGHPDKALVVLKKAHHQTPLDANILYMLITLHQRRGETKTALIYAEKLAKIYPENRMIRQLVTDLKRQQSN